MNERGSVQTRKLADLVRSVSSGTVTSRVALGRFPLYGSTGFIGRTNQGVYSGPSILVARVGANAGAVYSVDGQYGVTDNTLIVRPGGGIDAEFLEFYLDYMQLNRHVYGSGQPLITGRILKSLDVPLLSPGAASAVSEVLREITSLILSFERLLAKKLAIKQGMMQELLTGRTRLPGFDGLWQKRKLGDLLTYEQPGRYLVASTEYVKSGTPVLTAGKTFLLGYTSEKQGVYDSLPVIIFDDFTTASKYVTFPFKAKSSAMKILSPTTGTDLRFIYERMQLINFVAVDHKRRWISEYSKLEVSVPTLAEQTAIARVLEDAEGEIVALKNRLESTRNVKQGMMQELLTGRTRLKVEATA